MEHKKTIGGYFELELPCKAEYYTNAVRLNTGRNCLEYILRLRQYKKVYIPYYTCEVVLEPFHKLNIEYEFYHINEKLEFADSIHLKEKEAILYTNYFGLKSSYLNVLKNKFGTSLIVDNTQAFYSKPLESVDSFNTCRKFFGVSDGAYCFTDKLLDEDFEQDKSFERLAFLTKRIDLSAEEGYADFKKQSELLENSPIKTMSRFTQRMMCAIDYEGIAQKRIANYRQLENALGKTNGIHLLLDKNDVPMVYPYFTKDKDLRSMLIENKIFVAKYWPNVEHWCSNDMFERQLCECLLPLPVDQRYGAEDMERIIKLLEKYER